MSPYWGCWWQGRDGGAAYAHQKLVHGGAAAAAARENLTATIRRPICNWHTAACATRVSLTILLCMPLLPLPPPLLPCRRRCCPAAALLLLLPLPLLGLLPWAALAGAYAAGLITEEQRFDMVRHSCPGAGACGGMYTANTMASSIEALGMSLPYSSSIPAEDPLKLDECRMAGR